MPTPDSTLGQRKTIPFGEPELVFRISRKTLVFGFLLGVVLAASGIALLIVVAKRLIHDWSNDVAGNVLFFAVSMLLLWAGKAVWKKTNRMRQVEVAVHAAGISYCDGQTHIICLWDQVEEVRWKQSKHYEEERLSYISHQVTVRQKNGPPLLFDQALENIANLARAIEKRCDRAKFFCESSGSRAARDVALAPPVALQEDCSKKESLPIARPSVEPAGMGHLVGEFSDFRAGPFWALGWTIGLSGITLFVLGFMISGAEIRVFGMMLAGLGAVFLALAFSRNNKRVLVYTEGFVLKQGSEMSLFLWRDVDQIVLDQHLSFYYIGFLPYYVSTRNNCRLRRTDGGWIQLCIPLLSSLACSALQESWRSWRARLLEQQSVEPPAGDASSTAFSASAPSPSYDPRPPYGISDLNKNDADGPGVVD